MSTFLFVTIDAGGNVPPAIEVGKTLLARGHRVRFLGHERQRDVIRAAGFEFHAFTTITYPDPAASRSPRQDLTAFLRMVTHTGAGQDLIDLLTADPADLVIIDCLLLSVLQAAQQHNQRHVVLFHTFYSYWDSKFATGPVGLLARMKGFNPRSLWSGAALELVLTDQRMDPAGGLHKPTTRIWCGVTERAPHYFDRSVKQTVLVSLSTLWVAGQEDAYRRILLALRALPFKALVTTGGAVNHALLDAPPNVKILGYAPHTQLLPHVSAVLTHGGHSTTMNALVHGLPTLVMPMNEYLDQSLVSQAVVKAGAGIQVSKRASASMIRAALLELNCNESLHTSARALASRFQQTQGGDRAANCLISAAQYNRST
jgi:UDP:flavonoid glycosyltransferase YjiC (YdhE family)